MNRFAQPLARILVWGVIAVSAASAFQKQPAPKSQKELDALEHLIIDGGILERDVTEIDLRSPTHYFFLLKNGEKKDAERGKET